MSDQEKPFVINDRRKFRMEGDTVERVHPDQADGSAEPASTPSAEQSRPALVTQMPVPQASAVPESAPAAEGSRAEPIPFPGRSAASPAAENRAEPEVHFNAAHTITPAPEPEPTTAAAAQAETPAEHADLPSGPTAEQTEEVRNAYDRTAERLDLAMRSANPGGDHPPVMDFTRLVQSVYMTALVQLGYGTPEGDAPQIDIIGARQSIDMLGVISDRSKGNLNGDEQRLIDSALFELRMGFLEVVQALSRQAQQRPPASFTGAPGSPFPPTGPGGPKIVR